MYRFVIQVISSFKTLYNTNKKTSFGCVNFSHKGANMIRFGFVSNSSSSSFIVRKVFLNNWQIEAIKDHIRYAAEELKWEIRNTDNYIDYSWSIEETPGLILGKIHLDNFDMKKFFEEIGINNWIVEWDRS